MGAKIKSDLTAKQEFFCQLFAKDRDCFGNGTQAYLKAFSTKRKKPAYSTARVEAHKLLTNPNIIDRIRELIDVWISDEVVDKELGMVILQYDNLSAKVAAIREYNKVKGRMTFSKDKWIDPYPEFTDEELVDELRKRYRELGKQSGDKEEVESA